MAAFRATGNNGSVTDEFSQSGDLQMLGETIGLLTTVGAGILTGALMAQGLILRSGSTGAYTDTTDTAVNILTALSGNTNAQNPNVVPGSTFRMRILNSVAFAETVAPGVGVVQGAGSFVVAASSFKDFLVTIKNSQPLVVQNSTTTNGSAVVTFVLGIGQVAIPIGPAYNAVNLTPGMTVVGTGIPTGTTILGVTQGQGGIVGVTLSANATASGSAVLQFGPTVQLDAIGGGLL